MDLTKIPRKTYDHAQIEAKWQHVWLTTKLDTPDIEHAQKPFYNLLMFPYPSAEGLHVGNMYAFTGSDIYGRFKRMQGYTVFEPIGLDGFGIHSENYALKLGKNPMDQAKVTEKRFYGQLHRIGAMFDWIRTVNTYDIDYYRWTQWLFVQLFKAGLAYRAKAKVNFCPSCQTVLADEQVIDGTCERCGTEAVKKDLEQWFFRITAYADRLLDHIKNLDWSEKVKVAQTNWIGKKEGINITYPVYTEKGPPRPASTRGELASGEAGEKVGEITCFTTRPDTNFGATFVVIAPEHEFVAKILEVKKSGITDYANAYCFYCHSGLRAGIQKNEIDSCFRRNDKLKQGSLCKSCEIINYVASARQKSEQERMSEGRKKTGVDTGLYCLNQLNNVKMPLYISDFVLPGFGTGAVVGVPGHDTRDFEFAQTFGLPVKRVVVGKDGDISQITKRDQVQEDEGTMTNSEFLDGLDIHEATQKMMDYLKKHGWGTRQTTYHLRDWLISRQRYWGPPIPMIYCKACAKEGKSWFTTNKNLRLDDRNLKLDIEVGKSKMENQASSFYNQDQTSSFQSQASSMQGWYPVPEDQLPVELPYIDDYKPSVDGIAPLAKHKEFFDTLCPSCKKPAVRETDVSDTFLDSSWYFLRYPSILRQPADRLVRLRSPQAGQVPFDENITKRWLPVQMYTGGAEHSVLHLLYSRFIAMVLHDLGYLSFDEPFMKFFAHGMIIKDGAKMSKSRGNIVVPDEYIEKYGADALRMYLMFMGPFEGGGDFRDTGMEGMARFIGRVWRVMEKNIQKTGQTDQSVRKILHKTIKKLTEDIERRRYNTALAALMECTNAIVDHGGGLDRDDLTRYILLFAPFAPHMSEEAWSRLHGWETYTNPKDSVHTHPWPSYDPTLIEDETVIIVVQVNGKMRATLTLGREEMENEEIVTKKTRSHEKLKPYLSGGIKKTIFVPGKLVNFVV